MQDHKQFKLDYPLTSGEIKEFLQGVDQAFIAAAKGEVTIYFKYNPRMKEYFDRIHLYNTKEKDQQ